MTKARNANKVPAKVWCGWSEPARHTFNRAYDFMLNNQTFMLHPKQEAPKPAHWKTTAWNSAWIAAGAVDDALQTEVFDIRPSAGKEVRRHMVQ